MKKIFTLLIALFLVSISIWAQNNCLTFSGATTNAGIPASVANAPTNQITVEAWVNFSSWRTNNWEGSIINKEPNGTPSGWLLRMGNATTKTVEFIIAVGGAWKTVSFNSSLVTNTWYHIAGVYDGTFARLYINGVQVGTPVAATGSITTNTVACQIGNTAAWTDRWFPGKIDEVRVWNTGLSAGAINAWYNKTIQSCHPNYANLVGYYECDDMSVPATLKATLGADGTVSVAPYGAATNASFLGVVSGFQSVTAEQASTATITPNSTNKEVIRVAVTTLTPMDLTQLVLRTDGTTNVADITNAKIYSTGSSGVFATTTQFGSTIATPPAAGTDMVFNGTYSMGCGTYYFWLTYDIPSGATLGNVVDGILQDATVDGISRTPVVSNPTGSRTINNEVTVQIGSGTSTSSYFPIYTCYGYNYSQQIYLGSEITTGGGGSGLISKIKFYYNTAATFGTWTSWTIYIGNTSKTLFSSTTDWVPVGSMTQVFSGNIPTPTVGTWMELTLSTPFLYTGENLVIAVDENTASYACTAAWRSFASGANRGILYYSDGTNPNPATPPTANYGPNANIAQVQFVMTPATPMSFVSATTTQASTADVIPGQTNREILGIQVVTSGVTSPMALTELSMEALGTNPIADISKIHVYYTGTNGTFAATNAFDGTGTNVTAGTITITGSQILASGTNYFWIAYDISATATGGNTVDARLLASPTTTMVVGGTGRTVAVNDPVGSRPIVCNAPGITTHPGNQSVNSTGGSATFTVVATYGTGYQWQESIDGGANWSPITNGGVYGGATTASLTLTNPTYAMNNYKYRCEVSGCATPNALTDGNATLTVVLTYCNSIPSNAIDEEIYSVTLNGATNAYNCTTVAPGPGSILNRYSNFTTLGSLTNLIQSSTVSFTIEENECDGPTYYTNGVAIWIDYNIDGDFTDAGEQVFVENTLTVSPRTINGTFTIPATATLGQTRMRIICAESFSGTGLTPCLTYSYGETEDYTVTIAPALPMTFVSATATQASTADVMPGASNQAIVGLQVVTSGTLSPIALTELKLEMAGTMPTTDVSNIHVYYTGTNGTFAAANAYDGTGTTPAAGTITITGSQTLAAGTNYFWIAYDISPTATITNTVDAILLASPTTTIVVDGVAQTVTDNDPVGSRTIACQTPYATSIAPTTQTVCENVQGAPIVVSSASGGTWINSPLTSAPANTNIYGMATYNGNELQLTANVASQHGVLYVNNPNNYNSSVFYASFDMRMFDGGAADGMSFNYGNLPPITAYGNWNEGIGTGLVVSMSTYTTQVLKIKYGGLDVTSNITVPNLRSSAYQTVIVRVTQVGADYKLFVSIGGTTYVNNITLPASYGAASKAGWIFGIGARCGGVADKHSIKNLYISIPDNYEYSFDGGVTYQALNTYTPTMGANETYNIYTRFLGTTCATSIGTSEITSILVGTPTEGVHVPSQTQIEWNWASVPNAIAYQWNTTNTYPGTGINVVTTPTYTQMGLTANTPYTLYVWANTSSPDCYSATPVTLTQSTLPSTKTLNLKAYVEGFFYDGSGNYVTGDMHPVYDGNTGLPVFSTTIADTLTVELMDATFATIVARYTGVNLMTNGTIQVTTVDGSLGGNYFVNLIHRNSVPVTTPTAISFASSPITHDYSIGATYGGTVAQKEVETGIFAMYSGELNRDAFYIIDGTDLSEMEIYIAAGTVAYIVGDLDANGWVDGSDLSLLEPNVATGPYFLNPLTAKKKNHINK